MPGFTNSGDVIDIARTTHSNEEFVNCLVSSITKQISFLQELYPTRFSKCTQDDSNTLQYGDLWQKSSLDNIKKHAVLYKGSRRN